MSPGIRIIISTFLLVVTGCGNDPTGPGDPLVGRWTMISSSDSDTRDLLSEGAVVTMTIHGNGTMELGFSFEIDGSSVEINGTGTWAVFDNEFVYTATLAGETKTYRERFSVRGDILTMTDEDDFVTTYRKS
jgi:hypothetical protein